MLEAKETIQAEKQTKLEISSGILQLPFSAQCFTNYTTGVLKIHDTMN